MALNYIKNNLTRLSLWLAVFLLVSNIVNIFLIVNMLPLKEKIPILFQFYDDSNQIVRIEPIEKSKKGESIMMECLAREYVIMRETLNKQTNGYRWERLDKFTDSELSKKFYDLMKEENPKSPWKAFENRNSIRTIYIISSYYLGPNINDVIQVEWEAVDSEIDTGDIVNRQIFISNLTFKTEENETFSKDQYVNPLGFKVTHYSASLKKRPGNDFS